MLCWFGLLLLLGRQVVLSSYTPPTFDIEDIITLSAVGNVSVHGGYECLASGAFALTDALEISHELVTEKKRTFSVQEFVDCHHYRCSIHIENYVAWLQVNDRLAPADMYTEYKAVPFSCRAGMAPDGLTDIRVTGLKSVNVDTFEKEITTHGSVLACIDTTEENCNEYRDYTEGVIDGHPSEVCDTRVLIVGYTESYYRVRANNGAHWGEAGYFRISRGGNKCGIEGRMGVLMTERRVNKPGINPITGCPEDYPEYCPGTKTCRASDQGCQTEVKTRRKRAAGDVCSDRSGVPCWSMMQLCVQAGVRGICPDTCGLCAEDGTPKCEDKEHYPGECGKYARYCEPMPALKIKCPWTCKVPSDECTKEVSQARPSPRILSYTPPPTGYCYRPTISMGRAVNRRVLMKPGEKVEVVCRRGYTLVGEATYCEIQNVFKPDSRRMPTCMKMGGEHFEGKGASYAGAKSRAFSGTKCGNWQEGAHTGKFKTAAIGRILLQGGNHNFCRNIGDDFVPFCYTRYGQLKEYCFPLPRCGGTESDPCSSPRTNEYDCEKLGYSPSRCAIRNENQLKQVLWFWDHCNGMCCEYARCQ